MNCMLRQNDLTAVTLLTIPKTVITVGSKLVNGLARSNANLNLSRGTCMECRCLTPRRKADSWVASLSISSRFLNNCSTVFLWSMVTSIVFPKLSTASRNAALQRSVVITTSLVSSSSVGRSINIYSKSLIGRDSGPGRIRA